MRTRTALLSVLAAFTSVLLHAPRATAEAAKPAVIRIAFPGVGVGNRPFFGGTSFTAAHGLGWFQEEFKKDGIKVDVSFLRGAGPATNEAHANGLVDIHLLGDLPSIIGRAGGLKYRILLADAIRGNTYVAVPADSPAQRLEDLRGKRVAIFKGTNLQLAAARFFAAHGLTEKDMRVINMDFATAKAALITKDIDAMVGLQDVKALRDQGVAKIIYETKNDSPAYLRNCAIVASQDFIDKYPEITQRLVNVWVKAAYWSSQEKNRTQIFQLWTKSGVPFSNFKEDFEGRELRVLFSPLLDDYLVGRYKQAVADARKHNLIRSHVDVDGWIDRRFLDRALKELGLEGYWPEFDAEGRPKSRGKS